MHKREWMRAMGGGCGVAAAMAVMAGVGSASGAIVLTNGQSVPLTTVLSSQDHQVVIADKVFTFLSYGSASFPASVVFLSAFVSANPLNGIGFDLTGGFGDPPADSSISGFTLHYTVEVDPASYAAGYRITGSGLIFNGVASGTGSYARVDESVFDYFGAPGMNLLGSQQVYSIAGPPPLTQLQDIRTLPGAGYRELEILKEMQLFAAGQNGTSSASFVRQSFSQVVPGPGGAALAVVVGSAWVRRRRASVRR